MRELQIARRVLEIDSGIPPVRQITQCESSAKANKRLRNTLCGRAGVRRNLKKAATTEWARKELVGEGTSANAERVGPASVTRQAQSLETG